MDPVKVTHLTAGVPELLVGPQRGPCVMCSGWSRVPFKRQRPSSKSGDGRFISRELLRWFWGTDWAPCNGEACDIGSARQPATAMDTRDPLR